MARVKALVSFAGQISMSQDEIREVSDDAVVADLLHANYVELVEEKAAAKPIKRAVKKDESK